MGLHLRTGVRLSSSPPYHLPLRIIHYAVRHTAVSLYHKSQRLSMLAFFVQTTNHFHFIFYFTENINYKKKVMTLSDIPAHDFCFYCIVTHTTIRSLLPIFVLMSSLTPRKQE